MKKTLLACVAAAALAHAAAFAQAPQRIERAEDLPRYNYPVEGPLEAIVRDANRYDAFASRRRADIERTLAQYDIAETATRRRLVAELSIIDLLQGRWDDALRHSAQARELEDKPADKLMSGLLTRAIVAAVKKTGERNTPAYVAEVGRAVGAELEGMPFLAVRNQVQGAKARTETFSETGALGQVREVLQPIAAKAGALSSETAPGLTFARFSLEFLLPLQPALRETYTRYLAAHQVDKPDIWKARDVALPPNRPYTPVNVVVWDSGVDLPLFTRRLVAEGGKPAFIAFDLQARRSADMLFPLPPGVASRRDALTERAKGFSDLRSNVDSPQAAQVRQLMASLTPAQYKPVVEELGLMGNYQHGTHVAGIAMEGNPYARLASARISFDYKLLPDPCPTRELEERNAATFAAYADFFRQVGARVVNMSWGSDLAEIEGQLEQCGIGKDASERKSLARDYLRLNRDAFQKAVASLPDVLFVAAAGNEANDPTFNDSYPAGVVLPNLVTVGAVDKAGDEASFTSYGPTVVLHANGYQVESTVPGGKRIAFSGTSMAAPQVANLAAKILAVKPSLKPEEVIAVMRSTAESSPDGRRHLIHPARALAAVGFQP